jgi:inosine-uridine nucleoside N-ribohydrolase
MLLKSPEFDVRLVSAAFRDTTYRARVACRFLEVAGRTDVPVGVGLRQADFGGGGRQAEWIRDYRLADYPGTVHEDGVDALVKTLMTSAEPMTLVCIGPLPNIAEALRREPAIAPRTRFVGMHGSVYRGYRGKETVDKEWNVVADAASARAVFTAPWREMVITPVDTCSLVQLKGEHYRAVCDCEHPLTRALIENYRLWLRTGKQPVAGPETESSVLFDTVAVHLAYSSQWLDLRTLGIRVTEDGFTVPDEAARRVRTAVAWKDRNAFESDLVRRLCGPVADADPGAGA